jgi:CrcB protein
MSYLWIFIGGGLGSVARFAVSGMVARRLGETFPWGTLMVNLTGSLLIGFIAAATAPDGRWLVSPGARQFLMLGMLGGYTTFSSFSLQTLELMRDGDWLRAGGNVLLSVIFCLAGVWLGHALGDSINSN